MEIQVKKDISKAKALLAIVFAGVLSIVLAMAGVDYGGIELGALVYLITPIFATIVAIVIFILIDYFTSTNRKQLVSILFIILLLLGVFLRADFYCNIINW